MKKIGEILNQARLERHMSLLDVEKITKIRESFIGLIEKNDWGNLPPFPIVLGFVKSIAAAVRVDENFAAAILKRDYPPKKVIISPKPDVTSKFVWGPKITFTIGVAVVVLTLLGYLSLQYLHFVSNPKLVVDSPKDGQLISIGSVDVFGVTDSDAKIVVNNQPVEVADDGRFSVNLEVVPETTEITVQASARSGKMTTVRRTINVQSN